MPETPDDLREWLQAATAEGVLGRLLDRGLARGMIWHNGRVPPGAPSFSRSLTADLLDYAHTLVAVTLRLRDVAPAAPLVERAFLAAGEAIEAAVHRDAVHNATGFHRVTCAAAFHLAGYSARAYSMLPAPAAIHNLSPTEVVLVHLMRRQLDQVADMASSWLLNDDNADAAIARRLAASPAFQMDDACDAIMTTSFMRAVVLFDHATVTGNPELVAHAVQELRTLVTAARDLNAVSHWWTATLALHLLQELWHVSFHNTIQLLPADDADGARWRRLRQGYIQRLRQRGRAAIELWPSQIKAAHRALDPLDDLVVALPTGAGKTRIAELCVLRAAASGRRVIYVTPLRALSAQIERDLVETFSPLGFSVSALYGSAAIESEDVATLRTAVVVVATPEKLDFALRNDPHIIDDVGLVILDEGHMLGPGEREVRYEALVQRLLHRGDAGMRRIVCLSALFPAPDDMVDLVAWIRRDVPGEAVHDTWRPTRQRFGELTWLSTAARLTVEVGEENPFIPRFVEAVEPPAGSRRRTAFPRNKRELVLAAAWRFVEQGKNVLVYCPLRKSVEPLGKLVDTCVRQGVLKSLGRVEAPVRAALAAGSEWLGRAHPAVRCLEYGVALHHGGLPRPFLNEVEGLMRLGYCRVIIASPTLAQGLNLSASVLLVPSIWRNRKVIPAGEFANIAGRAGRAFVDVEGLVLHVAWERERSRRQWGVQMWRDLINRAKGPLVRSGILMVTMQIYARIAAASELPISEVMEYVTGNARAWELDEKRLQRVGIASAEWERDLASLDAAVLVLLDAATEDGDMKETVSHVLRGSLFSRQAESGHAEEMVVARARYIWSRTGVAQRRGYHAAGVGLKAGEFLNKNIGILMHLLGQAEALLSTGNEESAATTIVDFGDLVFQVAPFRPRELPEKWKLGLRAWVLGREWAEVLDMCGEEESDLFQDAFVYRLPWAMEATRVYALAVGHGGAEDIGGLAAVAVEVGSANRSEMVLLRSGLGSRTAARAAVYSTGAEFDDRAGMLRWARSEAVVGATGLDGWPTKQGRQAWLRFHGRLGSRTAARAAVYSTGAEFDDRAGMLRWARSEAVVGATGLDGWPTKQGRVRPGCGSMGG